METPGHSDVDCLKYPTSNLFKVMLDNAPGYVLVKDTKDTVLWCNNRTLELLNKSIDEVIGKTPVEIWPEITKMPTKFYELDKEVIEKESSKLGTAEFMEWVDGKEHLIRVDKIPYRNRKGQIAGVVTFIIDMTEALEEHIMNYNHEIIYHELRAGLGNIISILRNQDIEKD